jgi:hypothetical protein
VQGLKLLLGALHDNGVDHLLVGGYALYALGYQRGTVDIDRRYGVTIAKVFGGLAKWLWTERLAKSSVTVQPGPARTIRQSP